MDEYDKMVKDQRKWMLALLAILVIGLGITPYKQIFLGLLLGTAVSTFNLWFLQHKVKRFGKAISGKKSGVSLGTFTRMLTSVLAVAIALQFADYFNVYATVIGLASSYIVLMIDSFVRAMVEANRT
jgi:ATP synthase protein I